ncbi:heterokaryon incompatibility protein [Phlyctema vagabunda]|uniref:Heterokaryon incompatibility protein n=1 Tax=Phlyctema vagabunda TaxID=108571 RepID=A0ABR4PTV5_9HELO
MADFKQEESITCSCGDPAHKNLEDWYKSYLNSSAREKLLVGDKLNTNALEEKIQSLLPRPSLSNDYCLSCQKLLAEWPEIIKKVPEHVPHQFNKSYQQPHFKNTVEFEAGYRNGCLLFSVSRRQEAYFTLTLTWPGLKNDCWLPADPLYCIKNYGQELFDLRKDATRLTGHGGLSQVELAKKWLDACLETHQSCKSTEDYQLPTRLIDLHSIPIRLVRSSDLTSKPRYATLSHCWGTENFHKLQQSNLEDFMNAIPEEKLTKTFQDAIYITRSLGLRYLWIDSLCIIQHCDTDWRSESAHMSFVYSGSVVTIAATGATNGTIGCFLKPAGFVGRIRIEVNTDEVWDFAPSKFYKSVVKSPLAARAWALQERLLSPRALHFSKTELFWECHHCDASESFPEGSPEFDHQHIFHRDQKPISEIWDTVVKSYTGGKLTFPSDKMVAISGIAKKAFEENQDQYLAGLWRKDIEFQILWIGAHGGRRLLTGSKYRAPSWSWASMDENGYVYYIPRFGSLEYVYYAHFLSAEVVSAGDSPFGEIEAGELRMSYSLMLAGRLKKFPNVHDGIDFTYYEVEIDSPDNAKEKFRVYPDSDDLEGRNIYLLPVLESIEKDNKRNLRGLLVLPGNSRKGEYSRAGFFNVPSSDVKEQDRFLGLLKALGKTTAEARCAETLKEPEFVDERYVITLI